MLLSKKISGFWTFIALGVVLLCPGTIWATGGSVSFTHTSGSLSYDSNGVDANLDLFSGLYVGVDYNEYRFDNSGGTIRTYYGRLGRYTSSGSWKLFGSVTPEVGGFGWTSGGGEFHAALFGGYKPEKELSLQPGEAPGAPNVNQSPTWHPNPELDLIGGYTRTMFKDQGQNIDENDLTGGLGFNIFKTYLSGTFTKSVYDQEFSGKFNLNDLANRRFNVGYLPTILPGYPDYAYTASADQTIVPGWLWIFGSFSRIKFKAGPDDTANTFSIGTGVTLFHLLTGNLSYTRYFPSSQAAENFVSIGAGLRF